MSFVVEFAYAIGDKVEIATVKGITGHVIGLSMQSHGKAYRVCWWQDGKRCDEWLLDFELKPA